MYSFVNLEKYNYSERFQNIEMIIFSFAGFFIPFFVGHPQILVGTFVNAFLILAGLHFKGYRALPVILMPSLGVLSRGLIFGPYTIYLVLMIPFIWIGNALLVYTFRRFKISYWLNLTLGIALKTSFLFGTAYLLYLAGVLPVIFLTTMGILQVTTALLGGILVFSYEKIMINSRKYYIK